MCDFPFLYWWWLRRSTRFRSSLFVFWSFWRKCEALTAGVRLALLVIRFCVNAGTCWFAWVKHSLYIVAGSVIRSEIVNTARNQDCPISSQVQAHRETQAKTLCNLHINFTSGLVRRHSATKSGMIRGSNFFQVLSLQFDSSKCKVKKNTSFLTFCYTKVYNYEGNYGLKKILKFFFCMNKHSTATRSHI